ncbi:hypothetical protein O9G_003646 [Rozella allomycis CSF55]|uniref:RNI-like protein n=1 Tax=Rozella allomycis (strain CSF55) TaxID=988480 RepID=A0A075AY28_ROZAC|nr:hypothetical protein O9G_003646 [Rozella allomycis CSF55]|eukprot:EPZ35157.1 hypothetical protein O9G_003646 [Rozella allomycis CSF55]
MVRSVKGPRSALSSFLEERGISSRLSMARNRNANENETVEIQPTVNLTSLQTETSTTQELQTTNEQETIVNNNQIAQEQVNQEATASERPKKKKPKKDDDDDMDYDFKKQKHCSNCSTLLPIGCWSSLCASCQKSALNALSKNKKPIRKGATKKLQKLPHETSLLDDILLNKVPSLKVLCLQKLYALIEDIEAFGDIEPALIDSLCQLVCRNRKMNDDLIDLFIHNQPDITIYDCTDITEKGWSKFQGLPIKSLDLRQCGRLDDLTFDKFVSNIPFVESLSITGAFLLTNSALCSLGNHIGSRLKRLSFVESVKFTDQGISDLAQHCPNIEALHFCSNNRFTVNGLLHIKHFRQLRSLKLENCPALTDDCLLAILENISLEELKELSLNKCTNISSSSLDFIDVKRLKFLDLSNLPKINDECVNKMLEKTKNLTHLSLAGNLELTDLALKPLVPTLIKKIENLNLNYVRLLSKEMLMDICSSVCKLELIDLSWCSNVDDDVMNALLSFERNFTLNPSSNVTKVSVFGCHRISERIPKMIWDEIKNGKTVDSIVKVIGCPSETRFLLNYQ